MLFYDLSSLFTPVTLQQDMIAHPLSMCYMDFVVQFYLINTLNFIHVYIAFKVHCSFSICSQFKDYWEIVASLGIKGNLAPKSTLDP